MTIIYRAETPKQHKHQRYIHLACRFFNVFDSYYIIKNREKQQQQQQQQQQQRFHQLCHEKTCHFWQKIIVKCIYT